MQKKSAPVGDIASVGEFGLIAAIAKTLEGNTTASVVLGLGDDAAVVAAPDGRIVVSTDMLIEGNHFRRDWSSAREIGMKAAAANLIDVAAMGAAPTALVVALAVPAELEVEWVTDLYIGLRTEAEATGAAIVGGDVVRGDKIVISVTAFGDLAGTGPVRRDTAQPGDVLAVAGRLGWAAAGLSILGRGFRSPRTLVDAQRHPQPPYAAARAAARAGATAMIDVSDGLIADVGHMAVSSGVAIDIDPTALTVDDQVAAAAAAFNTDPLIWVLTGGEDHAVAATFPPNSELPPGFSKIGRVRAVAEVPALSKAGVTVGGRVPLNSGGHDHFAN